MHVTNKMIHKDVRLAGSILRLFTSNVTEDGYRKAKASAEKKANKATTKSAQMQRVYLERADGTSMRTLVLSPKDAKALGNSLPLVLYLHGGGYVLGTAEEKIGFMESLMAASPCVMVAPNYTLALDAPYPAALDDAYLALLWARDNVERLGARSDQIIVAGDSAGGGLTAALCIKARDEGDVAIAFQMPLFPMLDDRGITESARDNDAPMWNQKSNDLAWRIYLGDLYGTDRVPALAAPARLEDYAGLPPAYSYVGTIEPFYDETRIYFERLRSAGVEARLDTYEGGFHGFDTIGANKPLGKLARARLYEAFREACSTRFSAQGQEHIHA
ncbi:MAG: alpha/beta hydrolase [Atopobiaceae bacterium]|nr:alpha/beta hydrolase [Atopobiaceae bacterium]